MFKSSSSYKLLVLLIGLAFFPSKILQVTPPIIVQARHCSERFSTHRTRTIPVDHLQQQLVLSSRIRSDIEILAAYAKKAFFQCQEIPKRNIWQAKEGFLFRIAGKHLLLGTFHTMPLAVFSPTLRGHLASCQRFFSEVVPTEEISPFMKAACIQHLERLKQKYPYQGPSYLDRINPIVWDFPIIKALFDRSDLGNSHPLVFYSFLVFHNEFDGALLSEIKYITGDARVQTGGMDEVLLSYFSLKNGKKAIGGLETYMDRLFGSTFKKLNVELLEKYRAIYGQLNPEYLDSIYIAPTVEAFIKQQRERAQQISRGEMDKSFSPYLRVVYNFMDIDWGAKEEEMQAANKEKQAASFFSQVICKQDTPDAFEEEYLEGDLKVFHDSIIQSPEERKEYSDPEEEDLFFRNKNFFHRIVGDLKTASQKTLYTMGAAHLVGQTRVLKLLQDAGISI